MLNPRNRLSLAVAAAVLSGNLSAAPALAGALLRTAPSTANPEAMPQTPTGSPSHGVESHCAPME